MLLTGVRDGQILHRLPGKSELSLSVAAQGGEGEGRWWFLNGEVLSGADGGVTQRLVFTRAGRYQLSVLDAAGQVAAATFTVE